MNELFGNPQTQEFLDKIGANNQAAQVAPHDCFAWQRRHYLSTADYHATMCGSCDRIIGFRWKSKWQRIRSLFTSEPRKKTFESE